jgi:DNA-binding transcriptional LysR family regulator
MKLAFLTTLAAVLEHGSFSAAGQEIGLTASAVSLQIKQLEDFFGQQLFDRSSRTAQPTPFAHEVVATTQNAMAAIERLRTKRVTPYTGRVSLGTIRSAQVTTLPPALSVVRKRYPQLEVRLTIEGSTQLLHMLNAGSIDAALMVRPASGGSSRLLWHNLATERFILIAPPDSTLTSVPQLLRAYEWIRFDSDLPSGRLARSFVHRVAPGARGNIELASVEAIVAMVSAGLGVSIVPRLHEWLRGSHPVRELSLGRHAPVRQITFVCRAADRDNARVLALREAFEAAYRLRGAGKTLVDDV